MKTPILSVTRGDFEIEQIKGLGGGNGGQNKNKRATGVRITHRASGASATSSEHRDLPENRKAAFERCVTSPRFQAWLRQEVARKALGKSVEESVAEQMRSDRIRIEIQEEGRWVPMEQT